MCFDWLSWKEIGRPNVETMKTLGDEGNSWKNELHFGRTHRSSDGCTTKSCTCLPKLREKNFSWTSM